MLQMHFGPVRYRVVFQHWLPRLLGHDFMTFGRTIRVAGDVLTARQHTHAFEHIWQEHTHGGPVGFVLLYAWHWWWRADYNPLELDARDREYSPTAVQFYAELRASTPQ